MPRLLIVVDEIAELTGKSGIKTTEGKAEDALKDEILSNIQSITQLGRSAGIHCILCTQRNDANIISGVIQNNPLSIDTLVEVKEPFVDKVRTKINKLFRRDVA
jgi:DNA segregation ATPase FtsK/SpoIIIE-like protein